ncbi:site-specific integrase [bacterium 1xD42-67]|nr:site-specific integrase [bacterium 1xD42-67]
MPAYKDQQRGTWYASFYYTDWQGARKLKKKRGFARKKDAEQYEREFLHKEAGNCDMTFASMVDIYTDDMRGRLRESTMETKENIIEKWVLPFFGSRKLAEITPSMVRRWQSEVLASDISPTYAKTIHNQVSAIFNYACRYYGLKDNPARQAGSMGEKRANTKHFWTPENFEMFIGFVPQYPARVGLATLFWTGLRIGELLALTPDDVDLQAGTISVSKSFQLIKGREVVTAPKTKKSRRVVPLPSRMVEALKTYEQSFYDLQPTDRLFPFTKSYFHKQMDAGCQASKMEKIRLHDLRHSHASMLIHMGVPILLVSERLGHENVETTLQTYGHLYPAQTTAALEKMDQMMTGDLGGPKKAQGNSAAQEGEEGPEEGQGLQ